MLGKPSEDVYQMTSEKRLDIESEEPPILRVLDCLCHNEQMRSEGYPREDLAKIEWWQRLFAQFFDLREDLIHPA
ncbi:hypothetical protein SAMN05192563_1004233 [Paraburkholderia aspalathi]|uniref:Uncharacterized protein n=2 Tax=Paraburkholderia aspalathi TaxID=1324617 RepID=A0A1I7B720_9BURK|nr:hypothetical protein SAMN05192563_1004233 [Paraburkholderia aspalathi]